MKYVPNVITRAVGKQALIMSKNSPAILFGVGIVGAVASTVIACKATLRLEEVLSEAHHNIDMVRELEHKNYSDKDRSKDLAYIYIRTGIGIARLYGPSFILGVASIAALTGSHRILSNRNAALTVAYSALEKAYAKYRDRVVEELGEEREREIRYDVREIEEIDESGKPVVSKKITSPADYSVYARFFDEHNTSWRREPEYNRLFLKAKQNYANDLLAARGHLYLNEVYDMLGMARSSAGQVVGWIISKDGDNYVDFGIFDSSKEMARRFVNADEGSILLDFNVDGVIWDRIDG